MKKILFTLCFLIAGSSFAAEGVLFKFDIYQIDKSNDTKHLIYSDSSDIVVGSTITGFIGPFSLDIELLTADTIKTTFNAHVITLGTSANTYSKSFSVEYELPARFEQIAGKNKTEYMLVISPMSYKPDIDVHCSYSHHKKKDFSVKPTAHTEIYYVPSSLGDFYWDSVKEIMESNYRLFRDFLNLNIPGKIHIYIPPCPINSTIWDKRFGTSVDPTRNSAVAIYNQDFNTIDPFIITHALTLRTYGYSSPFLSEGLANYFSFAIYDMKKIVANKTNMPLESILETYAYMQADPLIADRISATFSRYLIDKYSLSNFLELYKKVDDLNLATTIQEIYKKPVGELEKEWLLYVDTVTIPKRTYVTFANASEMMIKYDLMHTYNLAYLANAESNYDSLQAFSALKRSAFVNGNYYQAVDYQKKMIESMAEKRAIDWMALGSYSMMVGENDSAFSFYQKALTIDSTDNTIKFNLAMYYKNIGNSDKAKEILLSNFSNIKGAGTQGETRILLADILAESDKKSDQESAGKYYQETVNLFTRLIQSNSSSPSGYMWLGKSYLGLYDYEKAINNLQIARFIESRPFYLGMIDLWLGKAYIASGDKTLAEEYLSSVLSSASSAYHQKEAKKLLEQLKK